MASAPTTDDQGTRPPMSTTSLPDALSDDPPAQPVRPPILASDILLEDVAPHHPAAAILRTSLAIVAAAFLGLAALDATGVVHAAGPLGALTIAAIAAIVAVFPLPYLTRATLAALTALVPLTLGAVVLPESVGHRLAGGLLLVALPCVLFFRARYRALVAARVVLGVAFALAAPGLVFATMNALDATAPIVLRVIDGVLVLGSLAGAFGFMGAETTGMCGVWASSTLVFGSSHVAAVVWSSGWRLAATAAVLCIVCATLLALAGFQLLAAAFANAARKVDVHRPVMRSEPAD